MLEIPEGQSALEFLNKRYGVDPVCSPVKFEKLLQGGAEELSLSTVKEYGHFSESEDEGINFASQLLKTKYRKRTYYPEEISFTYLECSLSVPQEYLQDYIAASANTRKAFAEYLAFHIWQSFDKISKNELISILEEQKKSVFFYFTKLPFELALDLVAGDRCVLVEVVVELMQTVQKLLRAAYKNDLDNDRVNMEVRFAQADSENAEEVARADYEIMLNNRGQLEWSPKSRTELAPDLFDTSLQISEVLIEISAN